MKYSIRSPEEFVSMPWLNGQGSTVEILKEPPGDADEFIWRLSMADVTEDGDFSSYPGIERTLLLLEGQGITLKHKNRKQDVLEAVLDSASFSGDEQTICQLNDGPIKDFNVMTHREHCTVEVITSQSNDKPSFQVKADQWLLFAVDGALTVSASGSEPIAVSAQHLLVSSEPVESLVECSGGAYISVCVTYLVAEQ